MFMLFTNFHKRRFNNLFAPILKIIIALMRKLLTYLNCNACVVICLQVLKKVLKQTSGRLSLGKVIFYRPVSPWTCSKVLITRNVVCCTSSLPVRGYLNMI